MPYIIGVLALVVIGVGYTLFQQDDVTESGILSVNSVVEEPAVQASSTTVFEKPAVEELKEPEPKSENPEVHNTPPTPVKVTTDTPPPPPKQVVTTTYTDGTYHTSNTYRTPEGSYTMDVTVTVSNDLITTANVQFDGKAARDSYSKRFASVYQSTVTGKELETVNLSRVGGASLTTRAFNNALDTIRSQAS